MLSERLATPIRLSRTHARTVAAAFYTLSISLGMSVLANDIEAPKVLDSLVHAKHL